MALTADPSAELRRNRWIMFVLVAVVVGSLAALAAATGWEETWASLSALTSGQVAVLLALSLINYVLRGLRWFLYCRVVHVPVSLIQAFRHYFGGFAMTVTPGRLGELVRMRWINQETRFPYERAAPILLMDRAADLAAMGILLFLAFLLSAEVASASLLPVAAVSLVVALLLTRQSIAMAAITLFWRTVGRWPRLFARLRMAARTLGPFSHPYIVFPALAAGLLGWFCEGLALQYLLIWLGAEIDIWPAVGIFALAMITGGATGAPGGLGGAEAAMVGLLSLQGIPLEISVPATVIIRLTTLWFAIAIGVGVFPIATHFANKGQRLRET
ncbi:lysylphosphatidylglycerol synthase transmembrane domain-containing protein [Algicella marina]|uniref:Flippase-like domain-containing protein n=1 Tax=Algicella marina TaxID=2683284 RepID=A0A6P1SWF3_9RHOB|nr:lysylphosphatidylglycerol synthase transmembrane domain-containing protein [Algicella marina]QHQ33673.1 flippase-like domain-containing protein [Algicella marina]